MARSHLFIQIHTHYLEKATKLLDDEIEEDSEEDRVDIAHREFNDNPYQYQNLYNNIDELFLHDDGRHIAPFQVLRALDDLTDYIKYTLDIDSVDLNKLETTFALALAFEWAREEPIVKLTDEERDYFTRAVTGQQAVVKSSDELTSAEKISIMSLFVKAKVSMIAYKAKTAAPATKIEPTPTHEQAFIVDDEFGCETCKFCGWMSEFPESHLTHAMQSGCQYIEARYDLAAEMEKQFN